VDNVDKLFGFRKHDGAIFLQLILNSIGVQMENSNLILYFNKDYTLEQKIENLNYIIDG
jgi:hypothetical protein